MKLTSREKEILHLVADGLTTMAIADKLCISPNTVANHRRNMLKKTGVKTSIALVQVYITKLVK